LRILSDEFGVYRCHTIYNCTVACPREIQITRAIGDIKKVLATGHID
jgi:succinate dehydrogenase / fumarate reductase iron-sulfur subunit